MALVDRTAYPRLPRSVAARELAEVFTPTGEEVSWARAKTTTDQHCLTLLVLLKCYQRLGYFLRPEQIPAEIAEHVRGCAELTSAGSIIDDDSPRLAKRYREFIREWAGVVWEPPRVRAVAESAMREALLGKDNPADVINVALEQLAQQRCELPAYSTLDRLAAKIRTEVNGGFHRLVAARLDAGARARMLELLIVDPRSRRSRLAELTQPAPKATVTRLKKHLAFLRWLDELGATQEWLAGVPPAKIAHFAGEAAVADAGELGDVGVEKRLTFLACLVHTARIRARDEVVSMFCKRMAVITKKAREHLEELRSAKSPSTPSSTKTSTCGSPNAPTGPAPTPIPRYCSTAAAAG